MHVNLTKKDLVALILGTSPSYKAMKNSLVKRVGYYVEGQGGHWEWGKHALEALTSKELWELHEAMKKQ